MRRQNRQSGFSLIELLIVIAIFTVIIMASSQSFVPLLSQSKHQSKIAATNIEGMLGLEVMRRDIAHAGYGLYWGLDARSAPTPTPTYKEVTAAADANGFALNDAPEGIPRPIVIGAGRSLNGSDRLAVKSVNVATNELSERWTYLYSSPIYTTAAWSSTSENIGSGEYVIVVRPDQTDRFIHFTTDSPPAFSSLYNAVTTKYVKADSTSFIFSLGTNNRPKMPFNRADYFISTTIAAVPTRCAPGTGVLYKRVVDQTWDSDGFLAALPLLDCVADMQIGYRYDTNKDGYADMFIDATADQPGDAELSRQIREVRVYILAQEGQVDRSFTYTAPIPPSSIRVGEAGIYGRDFNFNATITDWQNYRWKLYTLIVEPVCLLDWTGTP